MMVHESIVKYRPDGWRGIDAKEKVIKSKLFETLKDKNEVERIFPIIVEQSEY